MFHLVNALIFAGTLVLVADLLRACLPLPGVMAGTLYFATLPLQRVLLTWVSCSQDLLAVFFALAAFALYRRGRGVPAALAYLAALASKEVALPLPLALAAWSAWGPSGGTSRPGAPAIARRVAPLAAVALLWVALVAALRARHAGIAAGLHWTPVARRSSARSVSSPTSGPARAAPPWRCSRTSS